MLVNFRIWSVFICGVAACGLTARASASELVIGRDAVQAIVLASLFREQGKWYFAKGKCYAYLQRPRISLAGGRLIVDGHLSSRLGLEVGNACMGSDFVSDVRLSGRFVGAGAQITLEDIRIDNIKDESTRQALELLQSAAGSLLPKAVNIDLLQLINPEVVPGTAVKVAVSRLEIARVTTQPDRVTVDFEVNLTAR